MTQNDALKKIITDKGWLAVREILFDNSVTVKPLTCNGMITMDADNVYFVCSTSPAETEAYNKYTSCDSNTLLSYFKQLRIKGLDMVQGFDIALGNPVSDFEGEIKTPYVHNFKGSQTPSTLLVGNGKASIKAVGDYEIQPDEIMRGNAIIKYDTMTSVDISNGTETKFMEISAIDTFEANRTKFKAYIASLLGVNITTLL